MVFNVFYENSAMATNELVIEAVAVAAKLSFNFVLLLILFSIFYCQRNVFQLGQMLGVKFQTVEVFRVIKAERTDNILVNDNEDIHERLQCATQVFDEYGDVIRAMIRFRVNDESKADDIFQNFFLSLLHKPIPCQVRNIRGYLFRAINNHICDASRQAKRYRDVIFEYSQSSIPTVTKEDPQNIALRSEEIREILQLITRRLSPREAKAIIKLYIYGWDKNQAAKSMCVKRRSFTRYICMGLKKLCLFMSEGNED